MSPARMMMMIIFLDGLLMVMILAFLCCTMSL